MFVISNNGFLHDPPRKRLWIAQSTHSTDKSLWYSTWMVIQDDGNLAIFDQRTRSLCWARSEFVLGRIPKAKERFTRVLDDGTEIKEWKFSLGPI